MRNVRGAYVAFEGPIAAGKTTLAGLLAREMNAVCILEQFETNEFLVDYYTDANRWALPMQLSFLASRYRQLADLPQDGTLVADHTYAKDAVFASVVLSGRELRLYESLRRQLANVIRAPDVVVLLDAPNDVLLRRIKERGRDYEAGIRGDYLDAIRAAYKERFRTGIRVVEIETGTLDLGDSDRLDGLFWQIRNAVP